MDSPPNGNSILSEIRPSEEVGPPARLHEKRQHGRRRHPLIELTLARIKEFVREPEAVFWVFVFPVLMALALGIAFRNQPVEVLHVAVEDRTPRGDALVELLAHSRDLDPVLLHGAQAMDRLRTGKIELVIGPADDPAWAPGHPEPSFAGPLPSSFRFTYDPSRPRSRLARLAVEEALQRGMGRKDVARVQESPLTEPGARYIDFLIPGLIGLNLMASGMWGIGFNVVEARTRKLLKLLTATPMRRSHFLLSFMFSRILFLILQVFALVGFGRLVFGVIVHGSIVALAAVLLVGAVTFAGLGTLVASRSMSVEAVSGWMNLVMLPMWLLSGSFFSYSRFPDVLHPLIRLLPLTALNDALRSVMNEGAGLVSNAFEMGVLAAWGLVCFAVALRIFRWQ